MILCYYVRRCIKRRPECSNLIRWMQGTEAASQIYPSAGISDLATWLTRNFNECSRRKLISLAIVGLYCD